ncbi:MAG: hypothetical protein JO303_02485, partial [Caulobacteraceae bacterium]|nr:hypothetical protein [Caulobacteraceae bacterium]
MKLSNCNEAAASLFGTRFTAATAGERKMFAYQKIVTDFFAAAGIAVGGDAPHDIAVHNPGFYRRFFSD